MRGTAMSDPLPLSSTMQDVAVVSREAATTHLVLLLEQGNASRMAFIISGILFEHLRLYLLSALLKPAKLSLGSKAS